MAGARDPIETRRILPTVPDDAADSFRFAQPEETAKDAVVLSLRSLFDRAKVTSAIRAEQVTVEKYTFDTRARTEPYDTFLAIHGEFPQRFERLPHLAVNVGGISHRRENVGGVFVGHVQHPPRIAATQVAPFVLANLQRETRTVTVTPPSAPGVYSITIYGVTVSYLAQVGDTDLVVAEGLRRALATDPLLGVAFTVSRNALVVTIVANDVGFSFTPAVSLNLTTALVTAASGTAHDVLRYRTSLRGVDRDHVVVFDTARFVDVAAAAAVDVVRVFDEQALYARARTDVAGTSVELVAGGREGSGSPNAIEVLYSEDSLNAVSVLGLGDTGLGGGGDALSVPDPAAPTVWNLNVAAGTPFSAAMVGRYVTLPDATSPAHVGRHLITAVPDANNLRFTNADPAAVAESFSGRRWFVGFRDTTTNPARPVLRRVGMKVQVTVTLDIYASNPNERRELADQVNTFFAFTRESNAFTDVGRGVTRPDRFPDEIWQMSQHQEIVDSGNSEFDRPSGDTEGKVYGRRMSVPFTVWQWLDRPVTVLTGPEAGNQYAIDGADDVFSVDTLNRSN